MFFKTGGGGGAARGERAGARSHIPSGQMLWSNASGQMLTPEAAGGGGGAKRSERAGARRPRPGRPLALVPGSISLSLFLLCFFQAQS